MTRKRNDNHSTEFGLWLREQDEIDSKYGYTATNIDYVWSNYKNGNWIIIEEKRHNSKLTYPQRQIFGKMNSVIKHSSHIDSDKYKGFHLIVFENTSPEDGRMWLDNNEVTKEQLLKFLKEFEV